MTIDLRSRLDAGDYVSPNLQVIMPDAAFPNMICGDKSVPMWPYLRKWVNHNWYCDRRNPYAGFASRDEASILYNSALLFRGMPCLEVGCWRGWSAVHLALGAGSLDIIDPVFEDPDFMDSVTASCAAAGVLNHVSFHAGYSPAAIDALAQSTGKRWSLIFIDADHEGDAPSLDAEAAIRCAAPTAMVLFHDLVSPAVAAGLDAMRDAGWRTMIYQTMQIMGVAWRGDIEPVSHVPDPRIYWTLPAHLSGYQVSGWRPTTLSANGLPWPGMTLVDERNAALHRAQAAEDRWEVAQAERDTANINAHNAVTALTSQRDAAVAQRDLALAEATAIRQSLAQLLEDERRAGRTAADAVENDIRAERSAMANTLRDLRSERDLAMRESENARHAAKRAALDAQVIRQALDQLSDRLSSLTTLALEERALNDSRAWDIHRRQIADKLTQWALSKRVLFGLLRRPAERRVEIVREAIIASGGSPHTAGPIAHTLCRRRMLLGLLRRSHQRGASVLLPFLERAAAQMPEPKSPPASIAFTPQSDVRYDLIDQVFTIVRVMQPDHRLIYSEAILSRYYAWMGFDNTAADALASTLARWPGSNDHGPSRFQPDVVLRDPGALANCIERVQSSPFFDPDFYQEASAINQAANDQARLDPALHYLLIGEPLGLQPSPNFNPAYYARRYPDISHLGFNSLVHYQMWGRDEGRFALPANGVKSYPEHFNPSRENVIVVVHETSRTGAPILGWNIVKLLAREHNVYTVRLGEGPLTPEFEALSAEVHGPYIGDRASMLDVECGLRTLLSSRIFKYAIINSIESRRAIEACGCHFIPTLLLMHEFASYVWPVSSLVDAFDWSTEIVFPAPIVARSALEVYPALNNRPIHIAPQGMSIVPASSTPPKLPPASQLDTLRAAHEMGGLVVLGAGSVNIRKGVDLFVSVAAAVLHRDVEYPVHFVWVGGGYRPKDDMGYSVYLKEQIERSGAGKRLIFIDEVSDLEPLYQLAGLFLLTSRLDPLPNVSIDAAHRGIPIVCFRDASGTADMLLSDSETAVGVVPHLDVAAAADIVVRLAADKGARARMASETIRVAQTLFDMSSYVGRLDALGTSAAPAVEQQRSDMATIAQHAGFDRGLFLGQAHQVLSRDEAIARYVAQSWAIGDKPVDGHDQGDDAASPVRRRRPMPGFHPVVWAKAHGGSHRGAVNPLADFIRHGEPPGPWQSPLLTASAGPLPLEPAPKALLHIHLHDPATAPDMLMHLLAARHPCDVVITLRNASQASWVRDNFMAYRSGTVSVSTLSQDQPAGLPFLLGDYASTVIGYEVVGHFQDSATASDEIKQPYYREHLLGGNRGMLDVIFASFIERASLGLVFANEPELAGWEGHYDAASTYAKQLGITNDLPPDFDFPLCGMFWVRRQVLDILRDASPLQTLGNGELQHLLVRMLPFATQKAGLVSAVSTVPGILF